MRDSTVDVDLYLHHETDKALLVSEDEDSDKHWIPLSQIEWVPSKRHKRQGTATMPEWMAKERGWI